MTMRPNEFPETMWSACNEAQRKWVVANWNGWYGDDVRLALVDGRDVTWPPLIGGLPAAIVAESPSQDSTYDVLDPEAAPAVVPPVAIDVAQVGEGVTEVFTAEPSVTDILRAEAEVEWDGGRTLWGEPVAAVVLETVDATTLVTPLPAEVRLQSWAAEVEAEVAAQEAPTQEALRGDIIIQSGPGPTLFYTDDAPQEDAPSFEPIADAVLMSAVADAVISMDEREPTQEVARAAETFPPTNEAAEAPASLSDDAGPLAGAFSGPGWDADEGGPAEDEEPKEPACVERGFLHCDTPGGIRMALPFADVLGWASGSTQGTNADGVGCLLVVRGEALGVAIVVTGIQIAWVDEVLGPVAALPVANSYAEIEDAIADGVQEAA